MSNPHTLGGSKDQKGQKNIISHFSEYLCYNSEKFVKNLFKMSLFKFVNLFVFINYYVNLVLSE